LLSSDDSLDGGRGSVQGKSQHVGELSQREYFCGKSGDLALPLEGTRAMDVMAAAVTAPGEEQMKTFTIDETNNITAHASRKEAKETGLPMFGTEEQFADAIGNDNKRLLEIYNSLPGVTPVKKFAGRKVATERIWRAVQGLAGPVASEPEAEKPAETPEASPSAEITTPFDLIVPTPDLVAGEHQAAIESAADHVETPATPEADAELATASAQAPNVAPRKAKATKKATVAKNAPKGKKGAKAKDAAGPRAGSKMAQVIAMMQRKNGATLPEIMEKMGWQRHTVRGFMAGAMKKAGFVVESFKPEGGERTYRINAGGR
jgi:hypothetical protein